MTRNQPRNLGYYSDCWPALDAALAHRTVTLVMPNAREAIKYRHRCYRARKMLQDTAAETTGPGQHVVTRYDAVKIRLDPKEAKGDEPASLIFELIEAPLNVAEQLAALRQDVAGSDDELTEEAQAMRKELGLE